MLVLEFTHFFVDILISLDSGPCVTKGKWKTGKREKETDSLLFSPFFLKIRPENSPVMNYCNILIYQ
jgi:hypothetical protein